MRTTLVLLLSVLPCATQLQITRTAPISFERTRNGVFFQARVNGKPERLWFVLDSGASRTLLDAAAAKRLGIRGTESSTVGGAGAGSVPATIAHNGSIAFGGVTLRKIDFRLIDLSSIHPMWGRRVDGVVGYDLLCHTATTIDYEAKTFTLNARGKGETLPLTMKRGWAFAEATIKVPGNDPVTDLFLLDTGSQDAVDHPIIKKSTGSIRHINSGNGIGSTTEGVVGATEWFRIGSFKIGPTESSCCGNEETSRLIGAEVLSQFRLTFDYPRKLLYLERASILKE